MCKYVYILIVISAIVDLSSQINDDSITEESGEITEINKVVDSASKEDFEKIVKTKARESHKDSAVSKEVTAKPRRFSKEEKFSKVNVTTFNCEDRKVSSSEESQCRSTLVNYPFSASVQKKGAHYASGALIDKQHVLTVAEEFFNVRETIKLFRVRLGSVDCKRGGIVLPIKLVEIHPQFAQGSPSYDVALLTLSQPVETSQLIKPIALSNVQQGVVSANFLTTYWPRLIIKGELLPRTAKERLKHQSMRVSTQKLIPWESCATIMKAREAALDENSLCLKPITSHHSVCMPDVGAPVVAEDGLWGITSGWTSEHCSKYPSPTIFTRINLAPIRSWIKSTVGVKGRERPPLPSP